jgi:hypothetical protein
MTASIFRRMTFVTSKQAMHPFLLSGDLFQRARYESPDFGKLGAKTVGLTCRLQTASSYAFPQR